MRFSSQEPPLVPPPVILASDRTPKPFSSVATALYTLITLAVVLFAMRDFWIGSRLKTLWYPAHTATWVVTANMLVYDGLKQFSPALQSIYALLLIHPDELPRDSAKILRETINFVGTNDPSSTAQLRGQLAVLLAETGAASKGIEHVAFIQGATAAEFRVALRTIYDSNSIHRAATLTNAMPAFLESSWAAWRFESRWLHATGALWEAAEHDRWLNNEAREKAMIVLLVSAVDSIIIVVGLCLLCWLVNTSTRHFFGTDSRSTLSFSEGFGMLIRAELCGWVLMLIFCWHGFSNAICEAYGLLMIAPLVFLIARRHWRHRIGAFTNFVGMPANGRAWLAMLGAAICIVAVDYAFAFGVTGPAIALGFEGHWAETVDETLIHEAWPIRIIALANGIVWMPVYEELAFRGILFPALRDRLGLFGGALVSSVIFAAVHFYSLPGFLSVMVFGFASAVVFHHTRSLVPCVIAHIFVNLVFFGTEVALFA